jgi:aryl-alcohol dehydrogenase-like predicted oxidoreductase
VIPGYATVEGTARFAGRFPAHNAFYRSIIEDLRVSSLGLGTYLGGLDAATDNSYADAVKTALRGGINFIDSAINYRHQRSELAIGAALRELVNLSEVQRDEIVVCTKAGFLTPNAVPAWLPPEAVVGRMHSMAPDFLADQIDRSRANLGLDTIDVFYLHNPETQLNFVSREEFDNRIRQAFARLEELAAQHRIRFYGTATWDGYREAGSLDLPRIVELAREAGGKNHHFRFVQLPFNLGMVEAFTGRPESVLEVTRAEKAEALSSWSACSTRAMSKARIDSASGRFPVSM